MIRQASVKNIRDNLIKCLRHIDNPEIKQYLEIALQCLQSDKMWAGTNAELAYVNYDKSNTQITQFLYNAARELGFAGVQDAFVNINKLPKEKTEMLKAYWNVDEDQPAGSKTHGRYLERLEAE